MREAERILYKCKLLQFEVWLSKSLDAQGGSGSAAEGKWREG